jgi:Zn-dependent peptidase ImmA (M78 family)
VGELVLPARSVAVTLPEYLMTIMPSTDVEKALQGLGGKSERHAPTLVLGASARLDTTKRFAAARALWHFAAQPEREGFLLTPTRTDVGRIERAFAAELLASATGLREQLGREPAAATDDDLQQLQTITASRRC